MLTVSGLTLYEEINEFLQRSIFHQRLNCGTDKILKSKDILQSLLSNSIAKVHISCSFIGDYYAGFTGMAKFLPFCDTFEW